MRPIVMTIAGSDPSGGAGVQADLKSIEANGGYATTVISAVTAQNTLGVQRVFGLPPGIVRDQLDSLTADLRIAAVKTGMLASLEILRLLVERFGEWRPRNLVVDPVMNAHGGTPLMPPEGAELMLQGLFPLARLITPNVPEAEKLTGRVVTTVAQAEACARELMESSGAAVLLKGGHLARAPATDVLVSREGTRLFRGEYVDTPHTHGTGCVYSAAIATHLAHGSDLETAVGRSKQFLAGALRHALALGSGNGPTDPCYRGLSRLVAGVPDEGGAA